MRLFAALHATPIFIHLLLTLLSTTEARNCYLPNGDLEPNDAPCFPQNPESACCGGSTYVCATNNMCAYYDGSYYVIGSCTDKTWNSPACPGYCFFRNHVHNTVFRCSANMYCCADGPNCNCTTGVNTHEIDDFLPPYSELVGSSVTLNTGVVTSSLMTPLGATRTAVTTEATTSASQSTGTTRGSSSNAMTVPNAMATTNDATTASPTATQQPETSGTPKSVKVGVGVGVSLGVVAIVLAILLWFMWRKWKRKQVVTNTPTPQFQYQHAVPPPVSELGFKPYVPHSPAPRIYEAPGVEATSP